MEGWGGGGGVWGVVWVVLGGAVEGNVDRLRHIGGMDST